MKLTRAIGAAGLSLGIVLAGALPATAGDAPSRPYTKREKQRVTRVCLEDMRCFDSRTMGNRHAKVRIIPVRECRTKRVTKSGKVRLPRHCFKSWTWQA